MLSGVFVLSSITVWLAVALCLLLLLLLLLLLCYSFRFWSEWKKKLFLFGPSVSVCMPLVAIHIISAWFRVRGSIALLPHVKRLLCFVCDVRECTSISDNILGSYVFEAVSCDIVINVRCHNSKILLKIQLKKHPLNIYFIRSRFPWMIKSFIFFVFSAVSLI